MAGGQPSEKYEKSKLYEGLKGVYPKTKRSSWIEKWRVTSDNSRRANQGCFSTREREKRLAPLEGATVEGVDARPRQTRIGFNHRRQKEAPEEEVLPGWKTNRNQHMNDDEEAEGELQWRGEDFCRNG